jgi:ABC-2 type transport system permease protein
MLNLFLIESRRQWLMFKRYPVESFTGALVFTILFFGLFTGARYLAGAKVDFEHRLDVVVAGYVLWLLTTGLFVGPGAQITEDARVGILEQLFVSPHNFTVFTVIRVISGLVQHLLLIVVVLGVICLITHTRLDYAAAELLPFTAIVLAATGLGLMAAAYAMLVRQVNAVLGIGQFLLLPLVAAPVQSIAGHGAWLTALLPINPASQLLQSELATGRAATAPELAIALANGLAYFLIGALLLGRASRRARRLALIGSF